MEFSKIWWSARGLCGISIWTTHLLTDKQPLLGSLFSTCPRRCEWIRLELPSDWLKDSWILWHLLNARDLRALQIEMRECSCMIKPLWFHHQIWWTVTQWDGVGIISVLLGHPVRSYIERQDSYLPLEVSICIELNQEQTLKLLQLSCGWHLAKFIIKQLHFFKCLYH